MNSPAVSIVMVVCNMECFVSEAIESILHQTLRDFEFIVVDYGSSDSSVSIISRYQAGDNRIKLHVIPPCSLGQARNASCSFAHGKYVALMDADDVACPDRLGRQLAYLESHPQITLLGGAVECIGPAGLAQFIRRYPLTDDAIRDALPHGTPFCQTTVVMRREVLLAVKGYRRAFQSAEDYDLWFRVTERFRAANLAEPVVRYRIHANQVSVRELKQNVMCALAARAAAKIRAEGGSDPLWDIDEITPGVLAMLGVKETDLAEALVGAHVDWMNAMLQASNDEAVLQIVEDLLQLSHHADVSRATLSNACLTAASVQYKNKEFLASINSTIKAICIRPIVLARPIKRLLSHASTAHPNDADKSPSLAD